MMKRFPALLLCGTLCLSLAACGGGSGDAPKSTPSGDTAPQQTTAATPTPVSTPAPAKALEASGALGDFAAEIKDCTIGKDYADKPAAIITYSFTNNSDEATTAMVSLSGMAFQNGVQLDTAVIMDGSINAENTMKDIKPGASLDIQAAYGLNSETAPIEFELSETFSFSDEMLGKTFSIADGGATELATIDIPADAVSGTIEDCDVSIISCVKSKDYEDKDCVIVTYGFKNNSDKTANMMTTLSSRAYQDGVELSTAIISNDPNMDGASQMRFVKPGAAITVTVGYVLTGTSDIEVEVTDLFSMGDDTVARTFALA